MAEFTVTVTVETHNGNVIEETRTVEIPPDYDDSDTFHLYAQQVEATAHQLIEDRNDYDWVPPFKRAALLNDKRIQLIERRLARWRAEHPEKEEAADEIMAVLLKSEAALLADIADDEIDDS
jgi:hypothetical protein